MYNDAICSFLWYILQIRYPILVNSSPWGKWTEEERWGTGVRGEKKRDCFGKMDSETHVGVQHTYNVFLILHTLG